MKNSDVILGLPGAWAETFSEKSDFFTTKCGGAPAYFPLPLVGDRSLYLFGCPHEDCGIKPESWRAFRVHRRVTAVTNADSAKKTEDQSEADIRNLENFGGFSNLNTDKESFEMKGDCGEVGGGREGGGGEFGEFGEYGGGREGGGGEFGDWSTASEQWGSSSQGERGVGGGGTGGEIRGIGGEGEGERDSSAEISLEALSKALIEAGERANEKRTVGKSVDMRESVFQEFSRDEEMGERGESNKSGGRGEGGEGGEGGERGEGGEGGERGEGGEGGERGEEEQMREDLPVLPCFYIYSEKEPFDHSQKSQKSQTPLTEEEAPGEGWEGEEYEYDRARFVDRTFLKFKKKIDRSPEQCFRWSFGGEPLWAHTQNKNKNESNIDLCPFCGTNRVFELQIMPPLLYFFQTAEIGSENYSKRIGVNNWEWLTIAIFSCPQNCDGDSNLAKDNETEKDKKIEKSEWVIVKEKIIIQNEL